MTEKKLYPSWRYHRDGRELIVKDPEEDASLGPGWGSSPSKVVEIEDKAAPKPVSALEPAAEPKPARKAPRPLPAKSKAKDGWKRR